MKPKAFISSLMTEHSTLRKDIYKDLGDAVWVAEESAPELGERNDLEIVDACIENIELSDCFICIFSGRRGTRITLGEEIANATHFETELFHAAMIGKEIYVFIEVGYEPPRSLRDILEILEATIDPDRLMIKFTKDQIRKEVGCIVQRRSSPIIYKNFKGMVLRLFNRRRGIIKNDQPLTEFFAGNSFVDDKMEPNLNLVNTVLDSLAKEPDQRKQMSRIYIALREILTRPFEDEQFLIYRNNLLSWWGKSASWYGLHAHVRSGVLASAQSMVLVRDHLRNMSRARTIETNLNYPGGELASALYSISKHLPAKEKKQALHDALSHLDRSLSNTSISHENLLAIRGSIFRQLGMSSEAVKDYEIVLNTREKNCEGAGKRGDAMSELGFGYFRQGKIRKALEYIEKGVQLMREEEPSGFLLRGIKKLSVVRAANLQIPGALSAWKEVRSLAKKNKMYDQM